LYHFDDSLSTASALAASSYGGEVSYFLRVDLWQSGLTWISSLGSMLLFGEIGRLGLAGFTAKSIKAKELEQLSKATRFLFAINFQ
jgi:hypothetical protein